MAYLVTDRNGQREFRWLEGGRARPRRAPRVGGGDRAPAGLGAARQAAGESEGVVRGEIAATLDEADAVVRELEALGAPAQARLNGTLEPPLSYDHVHGTI